MKNREKFREEILNSVFRGKGEAYCEFAKKNVLPNLMDCKNGGCSEVFCTMCRCIFVFWLDEEYEEPEIDWSNVPVDTLVRVRDREDQEWTLMYFKGLTMKVTLIDSRHGLTGLQAKQHMVCIRIGRIAN